MSSSAVLPAIELQPATDSQPDNPAHPDSQSSSGTSTPTGYTPSQIRNAYGFDRILFPASGGPSVVGDGAGQTIAIVDAYNNTNIAADLAQFDLQFGIPPPPSFNVVNQVGGSSLPASDSGWALEIALDVEWAHAIAPGAGILLVETNSNALSDLLAGVNYAANQAGVSVVSMSWGVNEFVAETASDPGFLRPGVTFVASAGDGGAVPQYPAVSPNVLAVGGTSLNLVAGGYSSEAGWKYSGGGTSSYESKPLFQQSVQNTQSRTSPDVAYNADPSTGFSVYYTDETASGRSSGGWQVIGGTSAGAPQWAALVAISNQGRAAINESPLAFAGTAIYSLPASDFHDITSGNSVASGISAAPGYDSMTGRGTPYADRVVGDLVRATGNAGTDTVFLGSAGISPADAARRAEHHDEFIFIHAGVAKGTSSSTAATASVLTLATSGNLGLQVSSPAASSLTIATTHFSNSTQSSNPGLQTWQSTSDAVFASTLNRAPLASIIGTTPVRATVAAKAIGRFALASRAGAVMDQNGSHSSSQPVPSEDPEPLLVTRTAVAALTMPASAIDEFFSAWIDDFFSTPDSAADFSVASEPVAGEFGTEPTEAASSTLWSSLSLLGLSTVLGRYLTQRLQRRTEWHRWRKALRRLGRGS